MVLSRSQSKAPRLYHNPERHGLVILLVPQDAVLRAAREVFPVIFESLIPCVALFARLSVLIVLQKSLIDEAGHRVRDGVEATKLMRYYGPDVNFNPFNGIKDGEP